MDASLSTLTSFGDGPSLSLPALLEAVLTAVRRDRRSARRRGLPVLVQYAAGRVAAELAAAASLEDLDHRLEGVVDSEWFLAARYLLLDEMAKLPRTELGELTGEGFPPEPVAQLIMEALGQGVAAQARQCAALMAEHARASAALLGGATDAGIGPELLRVPTAAVRHLLDAVSVPAALRHAIRASLAADACVLALAGLVGPAAGHPRQAVEPWLGLALAERLAASLYGGLRLLASLPGVDVSTDLVPAADRLDLEAIAAEHRQWDATLDEVVRRAREVGDDVTFPAGAPLLDD